MTASLNGLRVLVTGGSRGIGRAICLSLAAAGARVAFVYHGDREAAAVTLNTLHEHNVSAFSVDADVSQEVSVVAMMSQVVERLGGLDVVVNNAGILHEAGLLETSTESFDAVIGVNLRGTFLVGREAIRQMVAQGSGRVINIASDLG